METNDTANAVDQTTENSAVETQELSQPVSKPADAERLLQESKRFKERAFKAEKELEAVRKAALTEQGKYKELYEKAAQEHEQLKKQVVRERVSGTLQSEAAKHGCVATDALMKLVNSELLQWDDETATLHGAELAIAEAKQKYPFLFQKQATSVINPSTPNGVDKERKLNAHEIAKLPHNQKMDLWKKLMTK